LTMSIHAISLYSFSLWVGFLLLLVEGSTAAAKEENHASSSSLIKWVVDEGGAFNPKQSIRLDGDGNLAAFAIETIHKGEVLARIPLDLVIEDDGDEDEDGDDEDEDPTIISCGLLQSLLSEISLGSDSEHAPYVEYLLSVAEKENKRIPSTWSQPGKDLLLEVMGGKDSQELLVPDIVDSKLVWKESCGFLNDDDNNGSWMGIAMIVQNYAKDELLTPLQDWYRHRNGEHRNAGTLLDESEEYLHIVATRTIQDGEQIHDSWTNEWLMQDYGTTADMFRDHGFIEQYPQVWKIPEGFIEVQLQQDDGKDEFVRIPRPEIQFHLEEKKGIDDGGSSLQVDWLVVNDFYTYPAMKRQLRDWFWKKLRTLKRTEHIYWSGGVEKWNESYGMPRHEWNSIWKFFEAYENALKHAVMDMEQRMQSEKTINDDGEGSNNPTCSLDLSSLEHHYDDFHEEDDWNSYNDQICSSSEYTDFESYVPYEEVRSNYQTMSWTYRDSDDDICLHLDNMLQICSSYRPHYHEFFVHYPARYVESVERVIYLGSGDAMLLHEILKYPNLKKVVGLELDQQVTRKSFTHFQTQPHYDDERVEWWYGDATKTLPLLPRDYWGTFDLVLVDLSETVVSMSVTGKHDILDVIEMLLKPEGIILENELYKDKMKWHFDHTIQIFYGSPKVCTQVLTMSSNKVDFLHSPIYDHGVSAYLLDPKTDNRFQYIHDYLKTDARSQGKCEDGSFLSGSNKVEHGKKAGVLQIIEAENITAIPLTIASLEDMITSVVRKQGLTPLLKPSSDNKNAVIVVMEEGYVVARLWPEYHYCALDINLWGAFQKSNTLRSALIDGLQSTLVSTYRVVVGGMYGSSTWVEDQETIGVEFSQQRNCAEKEDFGGSTAEKVNDSETLAVALSEVVTLTGAENLVVAVACGRDNTECASFDLLSQHPSVDQVIPIWACSDHNTTKGSWEEITDMFDCERKLVAHLEDVITANGLGLDMFVLDSSVPPSMIQIFSSIWNVRPQRFGWLNDRYVFVTPFFKTESFHQTFIDRFRKEEHKSALLSTNIHMTRADAFLQGLSLIVCGEEMISKLHDLEGKLRKQLPGMRVEVTSILGSVIHPESDLVYEKVAFAPEKYDAKPSVEQFRQQLPLGRQTVFQLDSVGGDASPVVLSLDELGVFLERTLQKVHYSPGIKLDRFSTVGDGGILVGILRKGSIVLVWDGRHHVDLNLFSYDESKDLADSFVETFTVISGNKLRVSLRDDQPRGIGRVVSFSSEIKDADKNRREFFHEALLET